MCGLRMLVVVPKHLLAENKVASTLALIPAFSPGEKENRSPSHSKTCDWVGRVAIVQPADGRRLIPPLRERENPAPVFGIAGRLPGPCGPRYER